MNTSQLSSDVVTSALIQTAFYSGFRLYKPIADDPRRLSWVLTLLVACVTTPISFFYAHKYVWTWNEAANFQSDGLSQFMVTFFLVFLCMDIICAKLHYDAQMLPLEGWFHHISYLLFFGFCLKQGYTIGVATTLPLEIPTVVLSLGKVFPHLRNDWLFGSTFFLLRICYHSFLLEKWYNMKEAPVTLWPAPAVILVLHLYWFIMWSVGQYKRINRSKRS